MSGNIQYRAISSIYDQLVDAVSSKIDSILPKAWNNNIVGELFLESSSSASLKSKVLVSAIATKVNKDSKAFNKFLSILREYPSLQRIASVLETRASLATMSNPSSKSTGTSNSPKSSRTNSPRSTRTRQPFDEMPKLDRIDQLTKESGIGGEMTNPSPIVSEEETAATQTGGGMAVHIPSSSSQQTLLAFQNASRMGENTDIQSDESALGDHNEENQNDEVQNEDEDKNFPVATENEEGAPVSVSEAASGVGQMVVSRSQQNIQLAQNDNDLTEMSVGTILRENRRKTTQIRQLEQKVCHLRGENERLERELKEKENEKKKTSEEYERNIKRLESQLKGKEDQVKTAKQRLAEAEKNSSVEKQQLENKITTLVNEREYLKSTVKDLHVDQQKKDFLSRESILSLREKLNKKQTEENERREELCDLRVKLAQAETVIANQKLELKEKDCESGKTKMKEMEQENHQLKEEKTFSDTQLKKMTEEKQDLLDKIETLQMSNPAIGNEPKPSQTSPTLKDHPPIEHQTSEKPSTEKQNSQTESAGAPSRSTSTEDNERIADIETEAKCINGDTHVNFIVGDGVDSTSDMQD